MRFITVRVDHENNAETWWEALRERYPRFAKALSADGAARVSEDAMAKLRAIPGYSDGPEYARNALVLCGDSIPLGTFGTFEGLN